MDLWKVRDMFGRMYYYESEARFNRKHKRVIGEYAVEDYHCKKNKSSLSSWVNKPSAYRVIGDEWMEVTLSPMAEDKHINTCIQRYERRQETLERLMMQRRA